VRSIMRNASRDDYRFSTLVQGIVQSPQFTRRVKVADKEPKQATAQR